MRLRGFLQLDGKEELGRGRENKFLRKPPDHREQFLLPWTAAEFFFPKHWVSGRGQHIKPVNCKTHREIQN